MDEDAGVIIEAVEGRGLVEEEGDGTIGVPDNCASFEKQWKRDNSDARCGGRLPNHWFSAVSSSAATAERTRSNLDWK
jgi:hypothetical protein